MKAPHKTALAAFIKRYKKSPSSAILLAFVFISTAVVFLEVGFIIGYILIKGIRHITPSLFSLTYTSENVSLLPALINTLEMILLSVVIAFPIGIGSAIYLTEYAKRGNKLSLFISVAAETLQGIPSIVYGLFGSLFFVKLLGLGLSLISGALTLSIMILPLIMRTAEEAISSVPDSYREGSFGLGAGRLRTVFKIVLPAAREGIFSGLILSVGRIIGESAALIFTAGTATKIALSLSSSARTLAVHMYTISGEGLYLDKAYATAACLLFLVIIINALWSFIAKKPGGENNG